MKKPPPGGGQRLFRRGEKRREVEKRVLEKLNEKRSCVTFLLIQYLPILNTQ